MTDIGFGDSIGMAAVVTFIIQRMKVSPLRIFSWVAKQHPGVIRGLGALGAIATTAGFSWGFEGDTLTISGITLANFIAFVWVAFQQFVAQEGWFRLHKAGTMKLLNQPPAAGTGAG